MAVQDFLLDDTGDLWIDNDDLVMGNSDDQHNQIIVVAMPGLIRCSPLSGVGLPGKMKQRFSLKDADLLTQDIQLQLQADGATGVTIQLNSIIDMNVEATR